jgi:hypothetical protein
VTWVVYPLLLRKQDHTLSSNSHIAELVMELGGLALVLEQAGAHLTAELVMELGGLPLVLEQAMQ